MRSLLSGFLGFFLLGLSFLALILSFIPLLFLPVLIIALIVISSCSFILIWYEKKYRIKEKNDPGFFRRLFFERYGFRTFYRERLLSGHAFRAIRISGVSIILNISLYIILSLYSWFYYLIPFNRELNPLREIFRSHSVQEQIKPKK